MAPLLLLCHLFPGPDSEAAGFSVCVSQANNQRIRLVGHMQKDLLHGIGLRDWRQAGKSEIQKAGLGEGRPGTPGHGPRSCPQVGFLLCGSLSSAFEAFPRLSQAHGDYQG